MKRVRAARMLVVALAAVALAGCGASAPISQEWHQVDLPADFIATTLLDVDGHLVVGGSSAGGPDGDGQPALIEADGSDILSPLPVAPVSFYGARTLWVSLVGDGSHILALGGKTGGGHGNPRWTTWAGDLDGMTEDPAPGIEVFGGWGAGGLAGIVVVNGQPVIVGGHSSANGGLDLAIWLQQGSDWVRQRSEGTALAATPDLFPFATAVAVDGSDLVIAGYAQHLGGGKVQDLPAIWTGPIGGPWTRIDLPTQGGGGSAQAVTCDGRSCVITGEVDGALVAWSYSDGSASTWQLPALDVTAAGVLPALRWDVGVLFVARDAGDETVLVTLGNDSARWLEYTGPTGIPIAAAVSGGTLFVLTTTADGTVRLWSATG